MGKQNKLTYKGTGGYSKPFPKRMRKLMEEDGVTQSALAKVIGKTRQAVSLYANGETVPDINTFVKIADFFDVSYDYLLGYSDAPSREYHSAAEQTGLSEAAIIKLAEWREVVDVFGAKRTEDGDMVIMDGSVVNTKAPRELSAIIENRHLETLISYIRVLRTFTDGDRGIEGTREFVASQALNTFRNLVDEIAPFDPRKGVTGPFDFGRLNERSGDE